MDVLRTSRRGLLDGGASKVGGEVILPSSLFVNQRISLIPIHCLSLKSSINLGGNIVNKNGQSSAFTHYVLYDARELFTTGVIVFGSFEQCCIHAGNCFLKFKVTRIVSVGAGTISIPLKDHCVTIARYRTRLDILHPTASSHRQLLAVQYT
jgi:hypothetical protein